jgi:hypothetical protein
VRTLTLFVPTLKVLELVKNTVADDRVQLHVLRSFEPLPISPSDDQAMGYQLLQETIRSVFPEVDIVVPGNDFISCGWWVVVAGTASYLMPLPLPPTQPFILETAGCFCPWKCIFPLEWKRKFKQERSKNNKLGQSNVGTCLT